MVNLHVAELPETSVALKMMLVIPMGKTLPLEGPEIWVSEVPLQLSVTVGFEKVTFAPLKDVG